MRHIHKFLQHKSSESIVLTLLFAFPLFTLLPLGMDMFLPALNDISNYFLGSENIEKYAISLYLVFWGIGQLIWGRVADIIGRKKVALIGLISFTVFSYLISTVNQEDGFWFLFYRACQSFGGSACPTAIFAIIRDTFDGKKLTKAYSYLNGLLTVVPLSAPLIGAFLLKNNEWQYIFYVFFLVGIVSIFWISLLTTETFVKTKADKTLQKEPILKAYVRVVKNRTFVSYLFLSIMGFFGIIFFLTTAPMYLIGHLNVDKVSFGWMFMLVAFIFMLGSFITPIVIDKIGSKRTLIFAVLFYGFGGLLGVALSSFDTWFTYIIPMMLTATGSIIFVSACPAYALKDFKENAGTASGVFSALNMSLASLSAGVVASLVSFNDASHLCGVFTLLSLLIGVVYFVATYRRKDSSVSIA